MPTISAKFNDEEDRQLKDICEKLHLDKSDALRRATHQLWLALQIGKPFIERAGGRPQFLMDSGNPKASTRESRKRDLDSHLQERTKKRKTSTARQPQGR